MNDLLAMFVTVLLAEFAAIASHYLAGVPLKLMAGIGFILIGAWERRRQPERPLKTKPGTAHPAARSFRRG